MPVDGAIREEFNRWAQAGQGEGMEEHHLPIAGPTLTLMGVQPGDRLVDLGCGTGWLARRLAALVPQGSVLGIDLADEMIRRAEAASAGIANLRFLCGSAEHIPARSDSVDKLLTVESAYYWPSLAPAFHEILRVLKPGGSAWMLINFYRDNPDCHQWQGLLTIPMHLLSAEEWQGHFVDAGFKGVDSRNIPDPSPIPEVYTGRWFSDAAQMQRFRAMGALLVSGVK